MKEILRVDTVKKEYGQRAAVDGVSFAVEQGEFVGIMGASGSGKSTLLNLIATIDAVTEGEITVDGRALSGMAESEAARFRRDLLGFVFQDYNLLDTLTLRENIALALTMKRAEKKGMDARINEIAKKLSILPVLESFPYEVSGGQRQRCACILLLCSCAFPLNELLNSVLPASNVLFGAAAGFAGCFMALYLLYFCVVCRLSARLLDT